MILCENCRGQLSTREKINVKDTLEVGKVKTSCLSGSLAGGWHSEQATQAEQDLWVGWKMASDTQREVSHRLFLAEEEWT